MKRFDFASPSFSKALSRFRGHSRVPAQVEESVREIIADVEKHGDSAVSRCIEKFDKARLKPRQFRLTPEELKAAQREISPARRRALRSSIAAVKKFSSEALPKSWKTKNPHGAMVGEIFHPIRRVGIYVPGGMAPLASTAIMTATLAKVAKVPEIAVCTPSDAQGRVAPEILAALSLIGVEEIYRIGGVQAVAAMATGTRTVPQVDKIFGPGNAYVVEAKRQVFGRVGIDFLPGPSEVMVIAGNKANAKWVAADLLAQAEHGTGREKIYCVGFSEKHLDQVEAEMRRQAAELPRAGDLQVVFKTGYAGIRARGIDDAIAAANLVAPEHLELHLEAAERRACLKRITTAGSILVGAHTPTVLGDFVAGPSHVLPTGGSGHYSSGLRVSDFLRKSSFVEYGEKSLARALDDVRAFSDMEELDAHGRSAEVRFEQ